MRYKGLTLIELLILLTVLAMFFFIIHSAFYVPVTSAKVTLCNHNLKQQIMAIELYSQANQGELYSYAGGSSWPREQAFEHTILLKKYSGIKTDEVFCCPSHIVYESINDARIWQYSLNIDKASPDFQPQMIDETGLSGQQRKENYRLMDYVYLLDKTNTGGKSVYESNSGITWYSNKAKFRGKPDELPVIIDIISQDKTSGSFIKVPSAELSKWGLADSTNHKSKDKINPSGGNHAYADGHVAWVPFAETTEKYTHDNQVYYWK